VLQEVKGKAGGVFEKSSHALRIEPTGYGIVVKQKIMFGQRQNRRTNIIFLSFCCLVDRRSAYFNPECRKLRTN